MQTRDGAARPLPFPVFKAPTYADGWLHWAPVATLRFWANGYSWIPGCGTGAPRSIARRCGYFGSECDGGFADYTLANARNVHAVDSDLSDAELATFATSYLTAEYMLNRAEVGAEDRVLVTGASGGVGSALIQLARRRRAETVALCGEDKAASVKALGADHVLPRAPEDLKSALESATGTGEVTVVADVVGGPIWPQLIAALDPRWALRLRRGHRRSHGPLRPESFLPA